MKKIIAVIGARPQFIKHAPLEIALKKHFVLETIHTGQHYDENMSEIFFRELNITKPSYVLSVGSHSHAAQTGRMMEQIEKILLKSKPDAVLVYGDTNSTLAGALAAAKIGIKVIHVEAGLRSFNREMPEEINRVLTDHVSDILLVPTDEAVTNLSNEGIFSQVFRTGDIMKDMVLLAKEVLAKKKKEERLSPYYYATIHRPYNTDTAQRLEEVFKTLNALDLPVIFPLHPRTKNFALEKKIDLRLYQNIDFSLPKGYFENIETLAAASGLITDSGGMQKEAYILKVPCITVRKETEWKETLLEGWNQLVFEELGNLSSYFKTPKGTYNTSLYGDGHAADEMTTIISKHI